MRFRGDNKIKYVQNLHHYFAGIPRGVDFTVSRFGSSKSAQYELRAKCNPNWSLIVYGLTARQKRRFERAIEEQKND